MKNKISHIEKVEISGLWDKYNLVWNLNPDVNILAGINGSGKTTILDCICGLLSNGKLHAKNEGMVDRITLSLDNNIPVNYKFFKVDDSPSNLKHQAESDPHLEKILVDLENQQGVELEKVHRISFEAHSTSFDGGKMTLGEMRTHMNVSVVSTFDSSLKQAEAIQKLSNDKVATELDWEIYNLQKQYLDYQLNVGKRKDAIAEEASEKLKEELDKAKYPQTRFLEIIDNSFSKTDKKINRNENQIEFLIGDKQIYPYQLSSGEKQFLIILLTVLIQDNKPSILFMDEPEISLHIDWQKKLIGYIRELNPNVQLIIATHSPALIMEGWQDKVFEVSDLLRNVAK